MRAGPFFCQRILRIAQRTLLQGQTPASDAAIELIAELRQRADARVQIRAPYG
jgi:hypothetical protein